MNPRIVKVSPLEDYLLELEFSNGEKRVLDIKPYLSVGDFAELKELSLFNSVHASLGSIAWSNGLDLCPDCLYVESVPIAS